MVKMNLGKHVTFVCSVKIDEMQRKWLLDRAKPTGNILYLSDTKMVMLPSFQAVQGCSVPPYPVTSLRYYAVSGIVNGKLIICGGKLINNIDNTNNTNSVTHNYKH